METDLRLIDLEDLEKELVFAELANDGSEETGVWLNAVQMEIDRRSFGA